MKQRVPLFFVLLLFVTNSMAQHRFALNAGYEHVRGSIGYFGLEYRLNSNNDKNKNGPLNIGIGSRFYSSKSIFQVIPEAHINKTWKHFLVSELSASTKSIQPSLGLSFFNLARLQFGYSIPIQKSEFKGFFFGFHILLGKSAFYDEITIFGKN